MSGRILYLVYECLVPKEVLLKSSQTSSGQSFGVRCAGCNGSTHYRKNLKSCAKEDALPQQVHLDPLHKTFGDVAASPVSREASYELVKAGHSPLYVASDEEDGINLRLFFDEDDDDNQLTKKRRLDDDAHDYDASSSSSSSNSHLGITDVEQSVNESDAPQSLLPMLSPNFSSSSQAVSAVDNSSASLGSNDQEGLLLYVLNRANLVPQPVDTFQTLVQIPSNQIVLHLLRSVIQEIVNYKDPRSSPFVLLTENDRMKVKGALIGRTKKEAAERRKALGPLCDFAGSNAVMFWMDMCLKMTPPFSTTTTTPSEKWDQHQLMQDTRDLASRLDEKIGGDLGKVFVCFNFLLAIY